MGGNHVQFSRRDVLRLAATGMLSTFLAACERATQPLAGPSQPSPQPTQDIITPVAPTPMATPPVAASVLITPNSSFYKIAAGPDPSIPPD